MSKKIPSLQIDSGVFMGIPSTEDVGTNGTFSKEILVKPSSETAIYELFFDHHGKLYEDNETQLSMGVYGLEDPAIYKQDANGSLPKWYIVGKKVDSTDSSGTSIVAEDTPVKSVLNVLVELKFIEGFSQGVIIQFVGREGSNTPEVSQFVMKITDRLRQVAEVVDLSAIKLASIDIQPNSVKLHKNPRGPNYRTQERFRVFSEIKDKHPGWTLERVAMESSEKLQETVTGETVRNTYRQMGEKWERADRVR